MHMSKSQNVSARSKSKEAKQECFNRNIPITNIIFYLGKGFMLRSQIITLVRIFYGVNEHKANDMISDLASHGLIIKKQATDTTTFLYVLTKYTLSQYYENYSSRDINSIKLNNRKIWNNIYRNEFIIREIIPMMRNSNTPLELDSLFSFLDNNCINIFTTENQSSVYQLYKLIFDKYPIKDKENIINGIPVFSPFMNDYYKSIAELYNFQTNFLNYKIKDDYSNYANIKEQLECEKDIEKSPKEVKKNYYSLFNMVAAGFFFLGTTSSNNHINIGLIDKCNNMSLKKIYENIICIWLMLERYLGFYTEITLYVFMSNENNIIYLKNKESELYFDYVTQEKKDYNKRNSFFKNYRIPKQYWENISVKYIFYPLREKYNL